MVSRQPVPPLQGMSEDERLAWVKKAPVPVRDYVAHLEGEILLLEEDADQGQMALDFDEAIISLWTVIAMRRFKAGDQAGSDRAFRAARLLRVDGL